MIYKCGMAHPEMERLHNSTFNMTACGLCASVAVADRLLIETDYDLVDALQMSYDAKANMEPGTNYHAFAPYFAEKMGFKLKMTSSLNVLKKCLRTGGCAVANVGGDRIEPDGSTYKGVFDKVGHYVAVISVMEDGRLCILDSTQYDGKFEEEGRKGKVEVDGHFCYCQPEVLAKDAENRTPSFYCFWRK